MNGELIMYQPNEFCPQVIEDFLYSLKARVGNMRRGHRLLMQVSPIFKCVLIVEQASLAQRNIVLIFPKLFASSTLLSKSSIYRLIHRQIRSKQPVFIRLILFLYHRKLKL